MKQLLILLAIPSVALGCKEGYVPSDTPGICVEKSVEVTNPTWVSDEKPPSEKMPSYQRPGIKVIDAPSMALEDAQKDSEKAQADKAGKQAAGIQ